MKRLVYFLIVCVLNLFWSCEKVKNKDTTIQIYKFDTARNYSNNAPVELFFDKNKITSNPSEINTRWPVKLASGYYLNGSMGVNSGYLSLTIQEYNSYDVIPGVDSLHKLLVEKDPYIEYYQRSDDGTFSNENGAYGIDTAMINDLIRTDKLENYFDRMK
jgi:hypothetical protein